MTESGQKCWVCGEPVSIESMMGFRNDDGEVVAVHDDCSEQLDEDRVVSREEMDEYWDAAFDAYMEREAEFSAQGIMYHSVPSGYEDAGVGYDGEGRPIGG